jgi:hypothetical protein
MVTEFKLHPAYTSMAVEPGYDFHHPFVCLFKSDARRHSTGNREDYKGAATATVEAARLWGILHRVAVGRTDVSGNISTPSSG